MFRNLFIFLPAIIFLSITSFFYHNKIFSTHFVDEEYNFTIGKYLGEGEILYKDLFSNHQPLTHIFSMTIQKVSTPENLLMLIKRHREAIIAWSFMWSLLLLFFFRWKVFPFLIIYELSKIYLFGNLFLAESLAVYPLAFLLCSYLEKQSRFKQTKMFISGISSGMIFLMLAPLWVLNALLVFLIIKQNLIYKHFFLAGLLIVFIFVLKFISIPEYFRDTIVVNILYTTPATSYFGPAHITFLKGFLAPLISFTLTGFSETLFVIRLLTILFLIRIFLLVKEKKYIPAGILFIILGFSNLRFYPPGNQEYQGFHLMPWFATLTILATFGWGKNFKIIYSIFLMIIIVGLFGFSQNKLFKISDRLTDFFVNYSRQETLGNAINIMKDKNDRLFVFPDEWLIYWIGDVSHGRKMFGYYIISSNVSEIRTEVLNTFDKNPPEFLYCSLCKNADFEKYLVKYSQLIDENKNPTHLYVLKTKARRLSELQINELNYHRLKF